MDLQPEQLKVFREEILRYLDANNRRMGLPARAIFLAVKSVTGLEITEGATLDQVDYLVRRAPPLIEEVPKVMSKEIQNWRITQAGRAFLDQNA